jgi:hypothetical protein
MPANKLSAVPGDSEIDGAANLDQLRQIASTLMSALLLGTVTPKEGSKGKPALARRHRVGECCAAGFRHESSVRSTLLIPSGPRGWQGSMRVGQPGTTEMNRLCWKQLWCC